MMKLYDEKSHKPSVSAYDDGNGGNGSGNGKRGNSKRSNSTSQKIAKGTALLTEIKAEINMLKELITLREQLAE